MSLQALARRLRVFDFDVFFFGTAIVRFPRWDDWSMSTGSLLVYPPLTGSPVPQGWITLSGSGTIDPRTNPER